VWLSPEHTSPYRFYQFWLNTDDRVVTGYLKFFTWLDEKEIRELDDAVRLHPEKREAQRRLASEMTRTVHDETALEKAEQASRVLFGGEVEGLSAGEVADIFSDVPSATLSSRSFKGEGMPLVDILTECGALKSKGEARRAIEAGGIYLNNHRIADISLKVSLEDAIERELIILRRGRKNYWLIRIEE
jgi:tyrosyl-tRNA synthetase